MSYMKNVIILTILPMLHYNMECGETLTFEIR